MVTPNEVASCAARFAALWTRHAQGIDAGAAIFEELRRRHAEPWRHYHVLDHVLHCLSAMDGAPVPPELRDPVELALWFHDAIYTPGAGDNETRSAALFVAHARATLAAPLVDTVVRLVLATTHRDPPRDALEAWVLDLDLSSFGMPWPTFLADSCAVRAEQSRLSDADYHASHQRFLGALMERPAIFFTAHFHLGLEAHARANIDRLLREPDLLSGA